MRAHLRLDDSRPRGLASECICGRPGCTLWYSDQVVEALGVDIDLTPRLTRRRLALFALIGLGMWGLLAVLVWSLIAGVNVLLGRVL